MVLEQLLLPVDYKLANKTSCSNHHHSDRLLLLLNGNFFGEHNDE